MRPFVNNLLRSASAHVRSFSNPTPPESPSTTTTAPGENAETNADTTSTQQRQPSAPLREAQGGIDADTAPSLPETPEARRDVMQTDASSETTVVADDVETASEKKRRRRREKEARQKRNRRSDPPRGLERSENQGEGEDEGVSMQGGASAGSGDGAVAENDGPRVENLAEVDGARVNSSRQIQTVKADDDGKGIRVVVKEVEVEDDDDDDRQDDREGETTVAEQRVVNGASDLEPERDATHSEPRLVVPTSNNELEPTHPEPEVVDSPRIREPERTQHDPRRSSRRLSTLRTQKPPSQTAPTIKQLYPNYGLGRTIETPSKSEEHTFVIDSLDPPLPPTTMQPSAPSQPLPNLPKCLVALQAADLADPLRAAHMSATAHNVLADRLWRTVRMANYFYSPPVRKPAIIVALPQAKGSGQQRSARLVTRPSPPPQHHRAAVEKGVASFLSRTRKNDSSDRGEMNKFTRANRDMAFLLHPSLALERVVTKRELFDMFEGSYGRGGEEGVDWKVDLIGLGVLFDGGRDVV